MADGSRDEGDSRQNPLRPRPTISLPPRTAAGFGTLASPGPMTLVNRLFADDSDADCHSFSQLLAGVIASSPASAAPPFALPPGISPAGLLGSPAGLLDSSAFLAPSPRFGISHQEALAQVTAQAACSNSNMYVQSSSPDAAPEVSMAQATCSSNNTTLDREVPVYAKDFKTSIGSLGDSSYVEQRCQPSSFSACKPADDGYNWRKYGQKQVKKSEFPRSYYKCTFPNCSVTKKVEHALDGQVTEIIYKGQHNHEKPPPGRRSKDANTFSTELNGVPDMTEASSNFQCNQFNYPNEGVHLISKWDEESAQAMTENASGFSDGEEVANVGFLADKADENEPHFKKSKGSENGNVAAVSSQKTLAEPRIVVQTTSEVDLLDDGYRWRKYGQKVVKGNPNPRSYYRCTFPGCGVRKHVERASTDLRDVITTYEGKHNHDAPASRNSSHANAGASSINVIQPRAVHALNHKHVAPGLQLKEEYSGT